MKFKNDMGKSMFEMVLYLGLIVLLTASTIKMYADSVEKTRIIKLENQIDEIREGVNTYYLGRNLPNTSSNANAYEKFKTEIGKAKFDNPWGGQVSLVTKNPTIGENGTATPPFTKPSFGIKYDNNDTKRCINIATSFLSKGVIALQISDTTISGKNLSIGNVATNCTKKDAAVIGYFFKE